MKTASRVVFFVLDHFDVLC